MTGEERIAKLYMPDDWREPAPLTSQAEPPPARLWPTLGPAARIGLAGRALDLLEPVTEADPVAVLVTHLAAIGAMIGRRPHFIAGHAQHPPRLSAVIVGDTAKARKGTSLAAAKLILVQVDPDFWSSRVLGGFGSGEVLVDAVRDNDENGEGGVADKRILLHDPEFGRVLRQCNREGSTLSMTMRDAWDGSRLQARSRSQTSVATGHHIVILGHITADELARNLTSTEAASGFANRFLFVCARRSKLLAFGGEPDPAAVAAIANDIRESIKFSTNVDRMSFGLDARDRWEQLYREMAEDEPGGLLGAVVARPEPQTLRLAVTYALLDQSNLIRLEHLEAAWAVWQYSRASAEYLFGDAIGDEIADRLLAALRRAGPDGLDFTQQSKVLGRNVKAERLQTARDTLEAAGLAVTRMDPDPTGGRARTVTRATEVAA